LQCLRLALRLESWDRWGNLGLASQLLLQPLFHLTPSRSAPQNNWTPLHFAAHVGSVTSVRALVAAGADADAEAIVSRVHQCLGVGLDARCQSGPLPFMLDLPA
jgi:ankyrin repeat protein